MRERCLYRLSRTPSVSVSHSLNSRCRPARVVAPTLKGARTLHVSPSTSTGPSTRHRGYSVRGTASLQCCPKMLLTDVECTDICPTVLKKICRRHGLKRWPNRRLRSINKQIELLTAVIQDGCTGANIVPLTILFAYDWDHRSSRVGDDFKRHEISEQVALLQLEKARICFEDVME